MNKRSGKLQEICASLLILLFIYTAMSKIVDVESFRRSLEKQPFTGLQQRILFYVLPSTEILLCILLIPVYTRKIGLWLSMALLGVFCIYILLIILNYFPYVPCSCGGVLKMMGWHTHLIFNLFFITVAVIGLVNLSRKEASAI